MESRNKNILICIPIILLFSSCLNKSNTFDNDKNGNDNLSNVENNYKVQTNEYSNNDDNILYRFDAGDDYNILQYYDNGKDRVKFATFQDDDSIKVIEFFNWEKEKLKKDFESSRYVELSNSDKIIVIPNEDILKNMKGMVIGGTYIITLDDEGNIIEQLETQ